MSTQAVAEFLEQALKDPDLQNDLVSFAADHGYDFTAKELGEADLSKIAGGVLDPNVDLDWAAKKKPAKK